MQQQIKRLQARLGDLKGNLVRKVISDFSLDILPPPSSYRVYNRRTRKVMKTMNVTFDELSAMAFEQRSSKPELKKDFWTYQFNTRSYLCSVNNNTEQTN
nr:hypothetical protein [Tanacetum cinerariifolium]